MIVDIQSNIVRNRNIFNSVEDLSNPSNALWLRSLQISHIRHNGTAFQMTPLLLLAKLPFQLANTSKTVNGITHCIPQINRREVTKAIFLQFFRLSMQFLKFGGSLISIVQHQWNESRRKFITHMNSLK